MAEYIEREAVMDALLHEQYGYLCEDAINSIPAADVREVKRGKWIDAYPNIPNDPRMICSICGKEAMPLSTERYCPNCGADMRGKADETLST